VLDQLVWQPSSDEANEARPGEDPLAQLHLVTHACITSSARLCASPRAQELRATRLKVLVHTGDMVLVVLGVFQQEYPLLTQQDP